MGCIEKIWLDGIDVVPLVISWFMNFSEYSSKHCKPKLTQL